MALKCHRNVIKLALLLHCKGAFFMLYFRHKGVDNLNDIKLNPNKYIDSYDNECFAPQFWGDDEKCIVIITHTHLKTELVTA